MPDKEPEKEETDKIRSERFYEDDPENAFEIVNPKKKPEKDDEKK